MSNLWQQPYVNVFKHFSVGQWKKASKEGEVVPVMDKTVKSTIFKITGHIPANNYIQIPRSGGQPLGLTGRYFYLLFRPVPSKYFVVHVDVATKDALIVRLSFSNLFKEFKSTATWLQFPFLCNPVKGSVDFYASSGAKDTGPAPAFTRWTVLCLDLTYILNTYLHRNFAYVKSMRICANMFVKNVFTSDTLYDPGLSMAEAKKIGGGRQINPMPREFGFLVQKGEIWDDTYDLIRFPPDGDKKPFDSVQHVVDDSNRFALDKDIKEIPHRIVPDTKNISKCVSERVSMIHKLTTPKKPVKRQVVTQELPDLQDSEVMFFNPQADVHIYAHPGAEQSDSDDSQFQGNRLKRQGKHDKQITPVYLASMSQKNYKILEPDPILKLKRIVGFGGVCYRDVLWSGDLSSIVYPCHAVVVVMRLSNGHQRFFIGHTDKVSCLTLNASSTLLASGQTGQMSVVRVWKFQSGECLAMVKTHAHSLFSLNFSQNGNMMCGVGKDSQGKNMVVIWNTTNVMKQREINVLAKAHTDVEISRIIFAPFDDKRMASCGRDNVRLWRLKDGTLRSAPVSLGEYYNMEFTDICFESSHLVKKHNDDSKIFACSRSGHMFEISYRKVTVEHVRHLLPISVKTKHKNKSIGSGLAITSISINETFCATGSEDGFLRLWPLDFAHVYLEAEHDGAVTAVSLSSDGLKILAGTCSGNLGVLDVSTRGYTTVMRSHTSRVLSIAVDPAQAHLASVSSDNTIRVWDAETLQQLYDFSSPKECPTTICYHPSKQIFVCGFESGAVRAFNVSSTCLLAEHKHHGGSVTGVMYSPDGEYLYSCCSRGSLASYTSSDNSYHVIRVLQNMVAKGTTFAPDALAMSPCGHKLAFVGPSDFTVTVVDSRHLSELLRIDVTSFSPNDPVDAAVHLAFTPSEIGHLLVTTRNNRLIKLDHSGRMVAEVSNIHRQGCNCLVVSRDGRHLVTAGDKVLKVWDYNMRLDINFQVFIGHCEAVSKVIYTPDTKSIISTGGAIYIWDNLAARPPTPPIVGRMLPPEEADDYFVPGKYGAPNSINHSLPEYPRRTPPRPAAPSFPSSRVEDLSSIHNGDEFETRSIVSEPDAPLPMPHEQRATQTQAQTSVAARQDSVKAGHQHPTTGKQVNDDIQMFGERAAKEDGAASLTMFTKHSPHQPKPQTRAGQLREKKKRAAVVGSESGEVVRPTCLKHYRPPKRHYPLAERRYTAPPSQAGLRLATVADYGGNGRNNMFWSPDSGLFVYSSGCILVVEDISTGNQSHLLGHQEEISTLAVQHDLQVVASASGSFGENSQSQVYIWDLPSQNWKKVLTHHKHQVQCMAFSRDDRFLITVGDYREHEIVVWQTCNYTVAAVTQTDFPVHAVRWDPYTANEFASVGEGASLYFWLLDEVSRPMQLSVHEADVPQEVAKSNDNAEAAFTALEYAGDSTLYVTGTNGKVSSWDTRHNSCYLHWDADNSEIGCLCSGAGKLVTGSSEGHLRRWAVENVSHLRQPGASGVYLVTPGLTMEDEMTLDGAVVSACFDENVDMGIVGTQSGTLWYINWLERTSIRLISGHAAQVTDLAMAAGGLMATSSADGSVRVWVLKNKEQALQFQVKNQVCNCVAFAPNHQPSEPSHSRKRDGEGGHIEDEKDGDESSVPTLVAGYGDGTVRLFDVNTVEMQLKLHPLSAPVTAVAFSADGRMILSGGSDGLIAVSSPNTGMTVRVITDHRGAPITTIDVPKGQIIDVDPTVSSPQLWLACSTDRRVSFWSADWGNDRCDLVDWLTFPAPAFGPDGSQVKGKEQFSSLPISLAKFSPEEPDVVVYTGYGMNKCLQFYSLSQRKVVRTIPLTHWAASLDISPDGPLIAVSVKECLIKLIDYYEGSFQDFTGHDNSVSLARFSHDGTQLVSVANCQMLIWDVVL